MTNTKLEERKFEDFPTYAWIESEGANIIPTRLAIVPNQLKDPVEWVVFVSESKAKAQAIGKNYEKNRFGIRIAELDVYEVSQANSITEEPPQPILSKRWAVILSILRLGKIEGGMHQLPKGWGLKHLSLIDLLGVIAIWTGSVVTIYLIRGDLISLLAICFAYYLTKFIVLKKDE
jgi:hypothetical protein